MTSPTSPSSYEDQLAQALRAAGHSFPEPPVTDLIQDGLADGRRRSARRRVSVLGGSAALVAIAVGGALLPGALSPAKHAQAGPAASGAPAPRATTGAATKPGSYQGGPTGAEVLAALKSVLPHGSVSHAQGYDGGSRGPAGGGTANLVFDDGSGKAAIGVAIGRYAIPVGAHELPTCPDPLMIKNDVCHSYKLPNGTLFVDQGYEYPSKGSGTKNWTAVFVGKDGGSVELQEWNAPAEKDAPVSRPTPPLTAAQLKAAVTSTVWQPLLAKIPIVRQAAPATHEVSGAAILATLDRLIPHGISKTHKVGEDGYAYLLLNDGKGKGLLQINVQHWKPGDASGIPYSETLPDGTKVLVQQGPGEKGGSGVLMWTVDVLHPNGLRVVASEFNSVSQSGPTTRSKPVLTIAQLRAIVTSSAWKTVK